MNLDYDISKTITIMPISYANKKLSCCTLYYQSNSSSSNTNKEATSTFPNFSGVNSWNLGTILPPTKTYTLLHWDIQKEKQYNFRKKFKVIYPKKKNTKSRHVKLKQEKPVAIAISSNSTPPTHLTAGKFLCINKWFASSSKPHWQITKVAPTSCNSINHSSVKSRRHGVKRERRNTLICILLNLSKLRSQPKEYNRKFSAKWMRLLENSHRRKTMQLKVIYPRRVNVKNRV